MIDYVQEDLDNIHNLLTSVGFTCYETCYISMENSYNKYTKEDVIVNFYKYRGGMLRVFKMINEYKIDNYTDYLPNDYMKLTNDKNLSRYFRNSKIDFLI